MINFKWDPVKAESNIKKHKVSFIEAKSVLTVNFRFSFLMLGTSNESRVLIVSHCERDEGNTIRIISARKATKNERKFYEGG